MPKLPRTSGDKIIRALEQLGFVAVRQRGSHVVMKRVTPNGVNGCVVPRHESVAVGTLHSILRQAEVSPEELIAHL